MPTQYNFKDAAAATGVHVATGLNMFNSGENEASTGTAAQVSDSEGISSGDVDTHVWTTPASNPNSADWPNGTYKCVLQVSAATASLTYGLRTQNSVAGHFARVDSGLTADQETVEQAEAAFSGTGTKTATASWNPAAGNASDRFEALITHYATDKNQSLTLVAGDGSSYLEFPDAGGGVTTRRYTLTTQGVG